MKRNLAFLALLLLGSATAFAETRNPQTAAKPAAGFENSLLEDVVRMTRAQLPESSIIAFVRSRRSRLETDVTASDLIRLHGAGVSDNVVSYIARVTGIEERSSSWRNRERSSEGQRGWDREREEDRDRDRDRDRDMDRDHQDSDVDRDGVVAYDGPGSRDDSDDGDIEAYARPYRSVYDSWPGWWDYPYWWGISPYWGSDFFYGGGGRFHGGHGRDRGWHRGDGGDRHRGDGGDRHRGDGGDRHRGSSGEGPSRSGAPYGGSHGGSPHGGSSHGGSSHSGGSHGGGSHGGGGHGGRH
ncbi:MAG: hypothetical protein ABJC07_08345 [Acidobacteriota bacterium]